MAVVLYCHESHKIFNHKLSIPDPSLSNKSVIIVFLFRFSNCIYDRALLRYMSSVFIAHNVKAVACYKIYFLNLDFINKLRRAASSTNRNCCWRKWKLMVHSRWRACPYQTLIWTSDRSLLLCTNVANYCIICPDRSQAAIKYDDKTRER